MADVQINNTIWTYFTTETESSGGAANFETVDSQSRIDGQSHHWPRAQTTHWKQLSVLGSI